MLDQLIIGQKGSVDDFEASVATRTIGQPKKKTVKETIPYSNTTYDFSKINGEVYWEERELEYIFEMTASSAEELEEMKAAFSDWIMNVFQDTLYDPHIPDYHFVGTFEDMEFEDGEGMDKTTATVVFKAYPYKIANTAKTATYVVGPKGRLTVYVNNNSSHPIVPTINTTTSIVITQGSVRVAIEAGERKYDNFILQVGQNTLPIENTENTSCSVTFTFYEEVF